MIVRLQLVPRLRSLISFLGVFRADGIQLSPSRRHNDAIFGNASAYQNLLDPVRAPLADRRLSVISSTGTLLWSYKSGYYSEGSSPARWPTVWCMSAAGSCALQFHRMSVIAMFQQTIKAGPHACKAVSGINERYGLPASFYSHLCRYHAACYAVRKKGG